MNHSTVADIFSTYLFYKWASIIVSSVKAVWWTPLWPLQEAIYSICMIVSKFVSFLFASKMWSYCENFMGCERWVISQFIVSKCCMLHGQNFRRNVEEQYLIQWSTHSMKCSFREVLIQWSTYSVKYSFIAVLIQWSTHSVK